MGSWVLMEISEQVRNGIRFFFFGFVYLVLKEDYSGILE